MAVDCDVSKTVTAFLLNTCGLLPRPGCLQAAAYCAGIAVKHPINDKETECIPLVTGSVAEFYIEPMLPHVGDVDIMFYHNSVLAIPRGYPPPTQLPAEFHNYVQVAEIIDSHLPGYVYIKLRYLLTKCNDDNYNYIEYDEKGLCLPNNSHNGSDSAEHGPAAFIDCSEDSPLSFDAVRCVRCLVWPPQAADWPARHRNYGWPDSATVDRVVSNGCDAVGVAHRKCRQHEWMGKIQWRLSFSRAEITLINDWMPVQQIVYHMLRYFIKTERLTDCGNPGAGTLSNYHIKTLMLWACEKKPRSWWTDDVNLVRNCAELLHILSVWLTGTWCPHYFINNCNLVDNSFNVGNTRVTSKLMSVNDEYLSKWLMNNYIGRCAHLCPSYISRLFDDANSSVKLQKAISEIALWRSNASHLFLWRFVRCAEYYIPAKVSLFSLNARSCVCWMNDLPKIDSLSVYFSAVALLYVACKITRNGFNDELMDILSTVFGPNSNECCSVLSLRKTELNTSELVELLLKSAVEHLTTFRQLEAREFSSVATIVTTDFEALYAYKRGDYQQCLQLLLSTENVACIHTWLYAVDISNVPDVTTTPEFIQLLDDDIVSLTGLTVIINPMCRDYNYCACVSQLTLLLYLMTQCQLKLFQTLNYIKVARRRHPYLHERVLDQLTLKLIERKAGRTIRHWNSFHVSHK